MNEIPMMIRPMVQSGFKKSTGATVGDWKDEAKRLTAELAKPAPSADVISSMKKNLEKLSNCYHKAPEASRRAIKNEGDYQVLVKKMGERESTVKALIKALSAL